MARRGAPGAAEDRAAPDRLRRPGVAAGRGADHVPGPARVLGGTAGGGPSRAGGGAAGGRPDRSGGRPPRAGTGPGPPEASGTGQETLSAGTGAVRRAGQRRGAGPYTSAPV